MSDTNCVARPRNSRIVEAGLLYFRDSSHFAVIGDLAMASITHLKNNGTLGSHVWILN